MGLMALSVEGDWLSVIGLGGPTIGMAENLAVWRELSSSQLAQGAKVATFEKEFASLSECHLTPET